MLSWCPLPLFSPQLVLSHLWHQGMLQSLGRWALLLEVVVCSAYLHCLLELPLSSVVSVVKLSRACGRAEVSGSPLCAFELGGVERELASLWRQDLCPPPPLTTVDQGWHVSVLASCVAFPSCVALELPPLLSFQLCKAATVAFMALLRQLERLDSRKAVNLSSLYSCRTQRAQEGVHRVSEFGITALCHTGTPTVPSQN